MKNKFSIILALILIVWVIYALSTQKAVPQTTDVPTARPVEVSLTSKTWNWVSSTYGDGRVITPNKQGVFTVTFTPENTLSISTDCNHGAGEYTAIDGALEISPIVSTEMACGDSQETLFKTDLQNVSSYHFTEDGRLVLDIKFDSGSIVFN